MKILNVSLWPVDKKSIGGTERYVICLSSALKKHSIDNEVLMLSGKEISIGNVSYIPIKLSSIKKLDEFSIKSTFFDKFNVASLQRFAKEVEGKFNFHKYDIVHFNSLLFYFCAFNKKRIFTIHINQGGFNQLWGKNSFSIIKNIIKKDKVSDTRFIMPSRYYAKQYQKKLNKKVFDIPHSLPRQFFVKEKNIKKRSNEFLDIFVPSRLEIKQKGQDLLLESLINIKNKLPKFRVVFAGVDNQYRPNIKILEDRAKPFGIKLVFKSLRMDEMIDAYRQADLVVLPSRYESFGYSALESLALGKRTVLSDIPTHKEIALGNHCAFIARGMSPVSFGNAILKAVNSDRLEKVSKKWIDRYAEDQWAKKYISLYKLCLKK
jgi:glycosyltransferase involved in cell wall biosynthesis